MNLTKSLVALSLLCCIGKGYAQQPFSGCWHPDNIKNWKPETDPDRKFNRSSVPLQPRFVDSSIKANATQFADAQVSACLTMNPSCSQTPSQDAANFIGYNPTYWQYMDKLIWWGGSAGEGIIVLPSAPVVDAAHLNGVKVLGQVFFPPKAFAGDPAWLKQMLTKEGGEYVYARKLYEIAEYYGFDGWFINEEIHGALASDWIGFVKDFNKFRDEAGQSHMEIQWYDNGIEVGSFMDLLKLDGASYFLDYGSNTASNVADQMNLVRNNNIANPFHKLFFGVEVAQNGHTGNADKFKNLFSKTEHFGSPDLFNPEEKTWKDVVRDYLDDPASAGEKAYTMMETVFNNEARFWTNASADPTDNSGWEGQTWPGLANAVLERSAIQSKPFVTSFSAGLGKKRFVNGQEKGVADWYHRGMQDVLPTWRWWFDAPKTLSAKLNWDDAYNMGTSILVSGELQANTDHVMRLYKTRLSVVAGDKAQFVYKTSTPNSISLKLGMLENNNAFSDVALNVVSQSNGWSVAEADLSRYAGQTISVIALNFRSSETVSSYNARLGQLAVLPANYNPSAPQVLNMKIENKLQANGGDVRVVWDAPKSDDIHHYNIYMLKDGTKSLVGQTRNEGFYIPKFTRKNDSETGVTVYVTAVTKDMQEGAEVSASVNYRDLEKPEVVLSANKTIVAVNERVLFTAFSADNPTSYEWVLPEGAVLREQKGNTALVLFTKTGLFNIGVKVSNKAGTTEVSEKNLVEVANDVTLSKVSVGKKIHSVSGELAMEEAFHIIDGVSSDFSDVHQKWCIGGKKEHWVVIDLLESHKIYRFNIVDCKVREPEWENISMYKIYTSNDLIDWTLVVDERNNSQTHKENYVKPTVARYVKFVPYDPEKPITVRIFEFEIHGVATKLELSKVDNFTMALNGPAETRELTYGFGGTAKEDNFKVEVKTANSDLLQILNINHDEANQKVSFDLKAIEIGTAQVEVVITNGEWKKSSVFDVKIEDHDVLNVAYGRLPFMTTDSHIINGELNRLPENGITDGNQSTFTSFYAKGSVKIDLGKVYDARNIKVYFEKNDDDYFTQRCKVPDDLKIYVSQQDDEASYQMVDWISAPDVVDVKANEFVLPIELREVRYVRVEMTRASGLGGSTPIFLREIEVFAKSTNENPLLIGRTRGGSVAIDKQITRYVPVNLGDMEIQDNFSVDCRVVNSEFASAVTSYDEVSGKMKIDITGLKAGNTPMIATVINGDYQMNSNFDLSVLSGGNLAIHRPVLLVCDRENPSFSDFPESDLKTLVDGVVPDPMSFSKYWCGPTDLGSVTDLIVELEKSSMINRVKFVGGNKWSYGTTPLKVEVFIAETNDESAYKLVHTYDRPYNLSGFNKTRTAEFDKTITPTGGRFVKYKLHHDGDENASGGIGVRELEVYGEMSESNEETETNTLSIQAIQDQELNEQTPVRLETTFDLGVASVKDNMNVKVVADDQSVVKISKVIYDEVARKIFFEITPISKGNTNIQIQLVNGKWDVTSAFAVKSNVVASNIDEVVSTDVQIYPNPVAQGSQITVKASGLISIRLFNMQGNQLQVMQAVDDKFVMDMGNLLPGIYLVEVKTEYGSSVKRLIIK